MNSRSIANTSQTRATSGSGRRRRWTGFAAVTVTIALVTAPILASSPQDRSRVRVDAPSWVEWVVEQARARFGFDRGAETTLDRASRDARGRHHLTIEPGGDAVPPPPEEDGNGAVPSGG